MDSLHLKILCEIVFKYMNYDTFAGRHISPKEIGGRLGVSERTVRLRVRGMEKTGFIKYYQAEPNLRLLGVESMQTCGFEGVDVASKREALQHLLGRPKVLAVRDYVGSFFTATLTGSSNDEISEIVSMLSEKFKLVRSATLYDRNIADPGFIPSKLDWQILKHLRYDALCSGSEIASSLSISYRMAEYRMSKMLASRIFFIRAVTNFQQPGIVFYSLYLNVDPAKQSDVLTKFREMHNENIWALLKPRDNMIVGNLFSETPGGAEEALVQTLGIEGVKKCDLRILKEWIESPKPNWIDELLEAKIAAEEQVAV